MASTPKQQCRHIFADGHRCGSPTLRHEPFCYYHHTTRKPKTRATYTDTHSLFSLPDLEDRSAIQSAITLVLQRLANGNLDTKRAGLLLYGLQIALSALPKLMTPSVKPVEAIVEDPTHGPIAPESFIDTSAHDALTQAIYTRMGLNIQAVAENAFPQPKSNPNPHQSNTLLQKYPTPPQPNSASIRAQSASASTSTSAPASASGYAKPSGLALSLAATNSGFSPWGMPSDPQPEKPKSHPHPPSLQYVTQKYPNPTRLDPCSSVQIRGRFSPGITPDSQGPPQPNPYNR